MTTLNYGAILQAGQSLVPDMRQQAMQDEAFAMQRDEHAMRREMLAQRQAEMQRAQERQAQFQPAFEQALMSENPRDMMMLMARYPEFRDQVKPIWEDMDDRQKRSNLTAMGSVASRALAGDMAGAADMLETRVQADRAAGVADPADEALLASLRSDDPVEQQIARNSMIAEIAMLPDGDKFLKAIMPEGEATTTEREYNWRRQQFGQSAADQWLATEDTSLVTVEPGGSVYNKRDFAPGVTPPAAQGGGDPSGSRAGIVPADDGVGAVKDIFGGKARITSGYRGPNHPLSKKNPGSYHAKSRGAVDMARIPGMSFAQARARIEEAGYPIIEAIDEYKNPSPHATGGHWHFVLGAKGSGGPVTVRSVQEANKLQPGQRYRTPDGRVFVR